MKFWLVLICTLIVCSAVSGLAAIGDSGGFGNGSSSSAGGGGLGTATSFDRSLSVGTGTTLGLSVTPQEYGAKGNGNITQDGAMSSGSSTLTSATAAFTSADAGKLICVDGASATTVTDLNGTRHVETCGTISAFTNSTTVTLSFSNASGGAISSKEIVYATDDSTAIAAAISALATTGGTVWVPQGIYGLSTGLTMPTTATVNIVGMGGSFQSSNGRDSLGASSFHWLTKSLSGAGITYTGSSGTEIFEPHDVLQGMNIFAGAGTNYDGGGHEGIDYLNWYDFRLYDNFIGGWTGTGVYVDVLGNTANDAGGLMIARGNLIKYNGNNGFQIGGGGHTGFLQNFTFDTNDIENNFNNGLLIQTVVVHGLHSHGNNYQRNNAGNTNPGNTLSEVAIRGTAYGCTFENDYFESQVAHIIAFQEIPPSATTVHGCSLKNSYLLKDSGGSTTAVGALFGFTGGFNNSGIEVSGNYFDTWPNNQAIYGYPTAVSGDTPQLVNSRFSHNLTTNGDAFHEQDVWGSTAGTVIWQQSVAGALTGPAASITGGSGSLSTGSNSLSGVVTGSSATGNVVTTGVTCANATVAALQDDTTLGGAKVTASNATTFTFSATASDTVEYVAGCR